MERKANENKGWEIKREWNERDGFPRYRSGQRKRIRTPCIYMFAERRCDAEIVCHDADLDQHRLSKMNPENIMCLKRSVLW